MRKSLAGVAAGIVGAMVLVTLAGLSNSTEPGHAGRSILASPRLSAEALSEARAPRHVLDGLAAQAERVGLRQLRTVGAAGGAGFSRSIVVGSDEQGSPAVAIVDWNGHSAFMKPEGLLRGGRLAVYTNQVGTPTTVASASIAVFVESGIKRVVVHYTDTTARDAALTMWPQGGYASFAEVATRADRLPQRLEAFGRDGSLVATADVEIEPLCAAASSSCIMQSP